MLQARDEEHPTLNPLFPSRRKATRCRDHSRLCDKGGDHTSNICICRFIHLRSMALSVMYCLAINSVSRLFSSIAIISQCQWVVTVLATIAVQARWERRIGARTPIHKRDWQTSYVTYRRRDAMAQRLSLERPCDTTCSLQRKPPPPSSQGRKVALWGSPSSSISPIVGTSSRTALNLYPELMLRRDIYRKDDGSLEAS